MRWLTSLCLDAALTVALLAIFAPGAARAQESGKKVALVVGNNTYSFSPLRNAVNDARVIDKALREAGFRSTLLENATKGSLEEAASQFIAQLGPDDTALFFYAGHGLQIESENFLVPVDFTAATSVIAAKYKFFSMAQFLELLKSRGPKRSIIILDACRSNPVGDSLKIEGGLAQPQNAGKETYIAYSTGPGQTAADNPNGRNSWFSQELADSIGQRLITIEDVFTRVRSRVSSDTGGKQTPWSISNLTSKFYFYPPKQGEATVDPTIAEKWMEDAKLREQREDWPEAVRLVEQVIQKKAGGTLEAMANSKLPYLKLRNQAQDKYEASDFAASAALDEQALKLDPFALDAAFQGVNGYLLADRLPEAIDMLQQIRVRGTTASLEKATGMLTALAAVEPKAKQFLDAGVPQPPPVEQVLSGTLFHVPDFDAGYRYLISTPVDMARLDKDVASALTPVAPPPQIATPGQPPPPTPAAPATPPLTEAELKVMQAVLHVEVVPDPSNASRDISVTSIGGFLQIYSPAAQMPVLMNQTVLAREVTKPVPLPVGKYEIRVVVGDTIESRQAVEITPGTASMMTIRSAK